MQDLSSELSLCHARRSFGVFTREAILICLASRHPKGSGSHERRFPCPDPSYSITFLHCFARVRTGVRGASTNAEQCAEEDAQDKAAAHGLQRWQQGYNLREVTREWGTLNQCVLGELDRYVRRILPALLDAMARAREVWALHVSTGIEASVHQYFTLQQQEAAGHVKDLESALDELRSLEQERGAVWQEAAHDLRGNLGGGRQCHGGAHPSWTKRCLEGGFRTHIDAQRHLAPLNCSDDIHESCALTGGARVARQVEMIDATTILEPLCVRGFAPWRSSAVCNCSRKARPVWPSRVMRSSSGASLKT